MDWHNGHSVVSDGKLWVTASYLMCLDNVQIKDKNGNKIGVSDLKPGDNVKIFTNNMIILIIEKHKNEKLLCYCR